MSYASLGHTQCESTVGDANQPVERSIPTYAETIRKIYTKELYERTYMHTDDDLEEARKYTEIQIDQAKDPDTIKLFCTIRACILEELRRRYHS